MTEHHHDRREVAHQADVAQHRRDAVGGLLGARSRSALPRSLVTGCGAPLARPTGWVAGRGATDAVMRVPSDRKRSRCEHVRERPHRRCRPEQERHASAARERSRGRGSAALPASAIARAVVRATDASRSAPGTGRSCTSCARRDDHRTVRRGLAVVEALIIDRDAEEPGDAERDVVGMLLLDRAADRLLAFVDAEHELGARALVGRWPTLTARRADQGVQDRAAIASVRTRPGTPVAARPRRTPTIARQRPWTAASSSGADQSRLPSRRRARCARAARRPAPGGALAGPASAREASASQPGRPTTGTCMGNRASLEQPAALPGTPRATPARRRPAAQDDAPAG